MSYKSLNILDDIMRIISSAGKNITHKDLIQQFHAKHPDPKFDIYTLLSKLEKDKYILIVQDEFSAGSLNPYTNEFVYEDIYNITLDGDLFLERGGYFGKLKKEDSQLEKEQSDIELNKTIQFVIAITGAIAGMYYTLEILIKDGASFFWIEYGAFYLTFVFFFKRKMSRKKFRWLSVGIISLWALIYYNNLLHDMWPDIRNPF